MGNEDQKLSEHFSLAEFVRSDTASLLKIDNTPPLACVENLKLLCKNVLEPLRNIVKMPVKILSGYRCKELNEAVGGSKHSQHMQGQAADLRVDGQTAGETFSLLLGVGLKFDQLILEKYKDTAPNWGWVHISWAGPEKNRQNILRIA